MYLFLNQVLGRPLKVVKHVLFLQQRTGLVPFLSVLPSTTLHTRAHNHHTHTHTHDRDPNPNSHGKEHTHMHTTIHGLIR
jgi:hypothetical protein